MSKKEKLINKLKSKTKNFTYDELKSLLLSLGFYESNKGKTSGSRVVFVNKNKRITIHKPHPQKELMPYQIKELIYELEKGKFI